MNHISRVQFLNKLNWKIELAHRMKLQRRIDGTVIENLYINKFVNLGLKPFSLALYFYLSLKLYMTIFESFVFSFTLLSIRLSK